MSTQARTTAEWAPPFLNYDSPFAPISPGHPGFREVHHSPPQRVVATPAANASCPPTDSWTVESSAESPTKSSRHLLKQGASAIKRAAAKLPERPALSASNGTSKRASFLGNNRSRAGSDASIRSTNTITGHTATASTPPKVNVAKALPERPPPQPLSDEKTSQSEQELQEAMRISEQEHSEAAQQEAAELQKALDASRIADKGKGKAPERRPSTDPDELQRALSLSLSEHSASGSGAGSSSSLNATLGHEEMAQLREWERLQQLRRQSMFDAVDTSSLSIISERTELPLNGSTTSIHANTPGIWSILSGTPLLDEPAARRPMHTGPDANDNDENPSYFGLWLSSDAKGVLADSDDMTVLPPLSELASQIPPAPKLPKRPLPPVPPRPLQRSESETTAGPEEKEDGYRSLHSQPSFAPHLSNEPRSQNRSAPTSETLSHATEYQTAPEELPTSSNEAVTSTSSEGSSPSGHPEQTPHPTSNANSEEEEAGLSNLSENVGVASTHTESDAARSQLSSVENDEVTWPKHNKRLPPGARYPAGSSSSNDKQPVAMPKPKERHIDLPSAALNDNTNESEQDGELVEAPDLRFGYISPANPNLPKADHIAPFPDVIQLSNSPEAASGVPEYATFAIEAPTWSDVIRFLTWHSDTRIEAHPRDIQNEKVGCGETDISANFLQSSETQARFVRITVRLLPPNPHKRQQTAQSQSKPTRIRKKGPGDKDASEVNLPDHLVLPVHFSDVAAMLSTLRHLAFIAAVTSESQKGISGRTSYKGLSQLGLRIAQLDGFERPTFKERMKSRFIPNYN